MDKRRYSIIRGTNPNAASPKRSTLRDQIPIPTRFATTAARVFPLVDRYFQIFRAYGALEPTSTVVDVGCGWGRMSIPMLDYLSDGRYLGLDVDPEQISWANNEIKGRTQQFDFQHIDVRNSFYHSSGAGSASDASLPVDDHFADLIICCSVITHMMPDDILNYLHEFKRIIKPTGKIIVSLFLLNEYALNQIQNGRSKYPFMSVNDKYSTINLRLPEKGIALHESEWNRMLRGAGLGYAHPLIEGAWCGRATDNIGQDIAVLSPQARNA